VELSAQDGMVTVRLYVKDRQPGKKACKYLILEIRGSGGNRSPEYTSLEPTTTVQEKQSEERLALLAFCRSIMKEHGGTLRISTRTDFQRNSVIRIALPVSSC
jgi:hypothetical protein